MKLISKAILLVISTYIATFVKSTVNNKTEPFVNKTDTFINKIDTFINNTETIVNKTETFVNKTFVQYQVDYNKHYDNKTDEERAFKNFINNVALINDLSAKLANDTNSTKLYVVNKYTDENPEEFDEHYGFKLIPYNEVNGKGALRNQTSETEGNKTRSIKDAQLYDLYTTDELYKQYKKQFKKGNVTSKRENSIRYYRFVKTLVEINKNNMEGKALRKLDDQADKVQKPNEYF